MTICKLLDRDCPHHPISRLGIDNPDKGVLIHMCCVYSGYHAVISHVKMNHDTFATACQRLKLSIRSTQKTWSVFADAFSVSALEFGICTPKFSLVAIINWHLNYEGPKCNVFSDGSIHVQEGQNQDAEPTVLAEGSTGPDLNHNIVVLDPVELETDNWLLDQETDPLVLAEGHTGQNHNPVVIDLVSECVQEVEVWNIQCDGGHTQVAPPTEHTFSLTTT